MPTRRPLVAGNWKMNGSKASIQSLLTDLQSGLDGMRTEVAVCPPFVYLQMVADQMGGGSMALGAQNVCDHAGQGAYTGEIAPAMLKEIGCRYAIVGHSERRSLYGENDHQVAQRFCAAQAGGLIPILCVGEHLAERESGNTEAVVTRQLDAVVAAAGISALQTAVIAYEPVWAIGTGKTATPEQAQAVHAFIRAKIATQDATIAADLRILYGGSVKGANARELFGGPDIDGGLIGGASLDAQEFLTICRAAD